MSGLPTQLIDVAGVRIEYRLRRGGGPGRAYVLLPAAHLHARCDFGEDDWLPPGASLLVVSRPGYGRTPVAAGRTPAAFADTVAMLCCSLGLEQVTPIGISMGGRTALALAAEHPELVQRLILTCAVSYRPWPRPEDRRSSLLMFNPVTAPFVWNLLRAGLRLRPEKFLELGVAGSTTLTPGEAIARLGSDRPKVVELLRRSWSGRGFAQDLQDPGPDPTSRVRQPTLIVTSRFDGSIPTEHPQTLAAGIQGSAVVDVESPTHLLWWGDRAADYARVIAEFDAG